MNKHFKIILVIFVTLLIVTIASSCREQTSQGLEFNLIDDGTAYSVAKGTLRTSQIVEIPSEYIGLPVTSIGESGFNQNSYLKSITIPDSVTTIGSNAFRDCSNLTSIIIPESVTSIGNMAFENTAWYNNQPDGLVYAGKVAFKYKGAMPVETSITLLEGTKGIADYAFYEFSSLTSITIPDSVTTIGEYAFWGCSSLESITIPSSVTSIGIGAFIYCSSLGSIQVSEDNPNYNSIDGVLFNKVGAELIKHPMGSNKTSYVIPDSVTSIADAAFYRSSLTSITFGENSQLTSIGDAAFEYCDSLTSITIPDSIISIGTAAFYCSGLTSITFGENSQLTSIGIGAFEKCISLTSIIIPESVTSIGAGAFHDCWSLESVILESETPPSLELSWQDNFTTFYNTHSSLKIYVTSESVDAYKTADGWSEYADKIFPIED